MKTRKQAKVESHAFWSGVEAERAEARAEAEGLELTAEMRKPKADISKSAGRIERESPLFFGTGDNPSLF